MDSEDNCSSEYSPSTPRLFVNSRKLHQLKFIIKNQNNTGEDEDHFQFLTLDQLTIGKAPSVESFSRWVEVNRDLKCDLINGEIIVREVTSTAHSACEGQLFAQLLAQGLTARPSPNMRARISGNILQPDVIVYLGGNSTRPGGTRPGATGYAPLVIEVACAQRPLDLHLRAAMFLGADYPSVEIYVGIQAYKVRSDGTQALLAAVYTRANGGLVPINVVSFGTVEPHRSCWWDERNGNQGFPAFVGVGYGGGACNGPGIPLYILQFPAATVYATHPGGIPVGAPAMYTVDLHPLQLCLREEADL